VHDGLGAGAVVPREPDLPVNHLDRHEVALLKRLNLAGNLNVVWSHAVGKK